MIRGAAAAAPAGSSVVGATPSPLPSGRGDTATGTGSPPPSLRPPSPVTSVGDRGGCTPFEPPSFAVVVASTPTRSSSFVAPSLLLLGVAGGSTGASSPSSSSSSTGSFARSPPTLPFLLSWPMAAVASAAALTLAPIMVRTLFASQPVSSSASAGDDAERFVVFFVVGDLAVPFVMLVVPPGVTVATSSACSARRLSSGAVPAPILFSSSPAVVVPSPSVVMAASFTRRSAGMIGAAGVGILALVVVVMVVPFICWLFALQRSIVLSNLREPTPTTPISALHTLHYSTVSLKLEHQMEYSKYSSLGFDTGAAYHTIETFCIITAAFWRGKEVEYRILKVVKPMIVLPSTVEPKSIQRTDHGIWHCSLACCLLNQLSHSSSSSSKIGSTEPFLEYRIGYLQKEAKSEFGLDGALSFPNTQLRRGQGCHGPTSRPCVRPREYFTTTQQQQQRSKKLLYVTITCQTTGRKMDYR